MDTWIHGSDFNDINIYFRFNITVQSLNLVKASIRSVKAMSFKEAVSISNIHYYSKLRFCRIVMKCFKNIINSTCCEIYERNFSF